jgi:hypothetical protein
LQWQSAPGSGSTAHRRPAESIHTHLDVEVNPPRSLILHAAGLVDWLAGRCSTVGVTRRRRYETRALPARAPRSRLPDIEEFAIDDEVLQPDRLLGAILR